MNSVRASEPLNFIHKFSFCRACLYRSQFLSSNPSKSRARLYRCTVYRGVQLSISISNPVRQAWLLCCIETRGPFKHYSRSLPRSLPPALWLAPLGAPLAAVRL
jgi:hypothetical protein